jgi:hypothetical protein
MDAASQAMARPVNLLGDIEEMMEALAGQKGGAHLREAGRVFLLYALYGRTTAAH